LEGADEALVSCAEQCQYPASITLTSYHSYFLPAPITAIISPLTSFANQTKKIGSNQNETSSAKTRKYNQPVIHEQETG
jgi:hypothetical protein